MWKDTKYDWNALFDKFPNVSGMYIYFAAVFTLAICIWVLADKNMTIEKS